MLTKREQKAQATLQKILEAAAEIFSQYPLNIASIDDIAANAGVSRSSIYRYCDGKEDFLLRVVEWERKRAIQSLRLAIAHEQTAQKRLEMYFKKQMIVTARLSAFLKLNRRLIAKSPGIRQNFDEFTREEKKLVENILRFGRERSEFAIEDFEQNAAIIVEIMGYLRIFQAESGKTIEEMTENLLKFAEILRMSFEK